MKKSLGVGMRICVVNLSVGTPTSVHVNGSPLVSTGGACGGLGSLNAHEAVAGDAWREPAHN